MNEITQKDKVIVGLKQSHLKDEGVCKNLNSELLSSRQTITDFKESTSGLSVKITELSGELSESTEIIKLKEKLIMDLES